MDNNSTPPSLLHFLSSLSPTSPLLPRWRSAGWRKLAQPGPNPGRGGGDHKRGVRLAVYLWRRPKLFLREEPELCWECGSALPGNRAEEPTALFKEMAAGGPTLRSPCLLTASLPSFPPSFLPSLWRMIITFLGGRKGLFLDLESARRRTYAWRQA